MTDNKLLDFNEKSNSFEDLFKRLDYQLDILDGKFDDTNIEVDI